MKIALSLAAFSSLLLCAGTSLAAPPVGLMVGPPASVTMGPPASVTMGPPASVTMGPPAAVPVGPPSGVLPKGALPNIASELGKLNAAHAASAAMRHAAPNSAVGAIATYDAQMSAALALSDPAAQSAAIIAARQELSASTNKELTVSAATRIDSMLGIAGAPPELGTKP